MSGGFLMTVALIAAGAATQAQAGHGHKHHHNHSYGYGYGGYGGGYVTPNYGYYGYGSPWRQSYYHNTGHYDYHPTTVVPHGNHLHVIPGHYDWHNTGHWHH